jgi:hypothetical protein
MKRVFGILATGVLAACGSSSSTGNGLTPPTPTSYTYGTGTPVATNSMQATAASDANSNTSQIVSAATSGSVSNNAATLSTAPQLPDTITASLGTAVVVNKLPQSADVVGSLFKATKSGTLDTGCYTTSGNTITYNDCNYNYGSGITYTISGSLTSTPTSLTWNVTAKLTITSTGSNAGSYIINGNWTGSLTFATTSTDTVINGTATAAWSGNFTDSQENVNFAYTAAVVFKSLDISTSCDDGGGAISGKLDVSVTAVASNGITAAELGYDNYGYEFTWNGCDTILVAVGSAG